jgi:hypothetical protein
MNRTSAVAVIGLVVVVAILGAIRAQADAPGMAPAKDWAAVEWTGAGTPLPPVDASVDAVKAGGVSYLWSFEGNIGTYADGCTTIELLPGPDVRVVKNCMAEHIAAVVPPERISDACIRAQVLLGTPDWPMVKVREACGD